MKSGVEANAEHNDVTAFSFLCIVPRFVIKDCEDKLAVVSLASIPRI